jgi:hypothetical protein
MLTNVDRMTMAAGLEARVPFLDRRLVEWALAVPGRHKVWGGVGKRVLGPRSGRCFRRQRGARSMASTRRWARGSATRCASSCSTASRRPPSASAGSSVPSPSSGSCARTSRARRPLTEDDPWHPAPCQGRTYPMAPSCTHPPAPRTSYSFWSVVHRALRHPEEPVRGAGGLVTASRTRSSPRRSSRGSGGPRIRCRRMSTGALAGRGGSSDREAPRPWRAKATAVR